MNIKKKRIVITGGTSGIGYEIVKYLHPDNEVVVISRSASKLNKLSQDFEGVITYQADLSKLDDVETVADSIVKHFESIDLLINNAAVQHTPTFIDDEFKYETINYEITLNFTSICSLIYLLLPALLHQNKAVILNVNSALALTPKTSSAIYCATKGALNIFSQSLRYQLEKTNISVQQVFLELVDTSMTIGRGKNKISAEDAAKKIILGIERDISDNYIGKVKLLRIFLRLMPSIAQRILKSS
ncbi:hypothetical protein MNBD_GAMMA21-2510 [hydrothermal vent metagenome]|uniref:Oxidoreductase, short-chain dehydrogenase/reductase family n=1 Tax=hydrothermal vent metagenome TaxID=652676 RepID=A0A3B1AX54_9ZZZZ